MSDNETKNTTSAAGCYLPYIGILVAIYNLLNKKDDPYCKFHSYHSIFFWIGIAVIMICITIMGSIISLIPFIGPILGHFITMTTVILNGGVILYSLFCGYNAYQGTSFNIPYITEYTNKYLEDKKMLP